MCVGRGEIVVRGVELGVPGVSCVSPVCPLLSPPLPRPRRWLGAALGRTAPEAPVCSRLLLDPVWVRLAESPAIPQLSQLPPGLAHPAHHSRHLVHAQHQHKVQFVQTIFTFLSISEFFKNVSENLKAKI